MAHSSEGKIKAIMSGRRLIDQHSLFLLRYFLEPAQKEIVLTHDQQNCKFIFMG